jgi:hypothetical protein
MREINNKLNETQNYKESFSKLGSYVLQIGVNLSVIVNNNICSSRGIITNSAKYL